MTGFLPARDYQSYYGNTALLPGALLEVVLTSAHPSATTTPTGASDSATVVQASVSHDAVAGAVLQPWEGLTMSALLPGALVSARVREVLQHGLLVSFCGYFHGAIHFTHLDDPVPALDWHKRCAGGRVALCMPATGYMAALSV